MTAGLYLTIKTDIQSIWTAAWTHSDVPVFWNANDVDVLPEPGSVTHFLRNEVDFGRERIMAIGGGLMRNERSQFGSVVLRVFASRALASEDTALDLMADAMATFRSVRQGSLGFIGDGSGFDEGPTDDGNWLMRGALVVFEYRFRG